MIPLPIEHNRIQARRAGKRVGLGWFYIDEWGQVPDGDPWETREATDAEKEMWVLLTGLDYCIKPPWERNQEMPSLDAIPKEFEEVWFHAAVTFNAADFAVLRRLDGLNPNTDRETLQEGLVAFWERDVCHDEDGNYLGEMVKRTFPVYINRMVPKGYYLRQALKVWRPPPGERVLAPVLDDMELLRLSTELHELEPLH